MPATFKRSVVKAITYRAVIIVADFVSVYILSGKTSIAFAFMLVSNAYTTVLYFVHERIWTHVNWGRGA